MTEGGKVCPSHEHIDSSIRRQEAILEAFRQENANHKEKISSILADICAQMKSVGEIKMTQIDNMRRREDFTQACEKKREDIWIAIHAVKSRQDRKDGSLVLVAGVATSVGAAMSWLLTWLQKHL